MTAIVIQGDARRLPLPDGSMDLVVTSPPYFGLRSYTDGGEHYDGQLGAEETPSEFVDALLECTQEWMRVLKPEGSIFVNLGDKYNSNPSWGRGQSTLGGRPQSEIPRGPRGNGVNYSLMKPKTLMGIPWRYAIRCIDQLGLILRAEIIWDKPNGLPESVTDRVRRSHEQWFHFTKEPRYFSAVDEIREQYAAGTVERYASGYGSKRGASLTAAQLTKHTDYVVDGLTTNPLGKLPGSVWSVPSEPLQIPPGLGIDHFAAFPTAWPKRLIRGWAPADGTVLDPFGGTGTTALVASALGRTGISVDLSHDYCRLARWRTTDRAQLAKVLEVDKPPVELDGQDHLFELA